MLILEWALHPARRAAPRHRADGARSVATRLARCQQVLAALLLALLCGCTDLRVSQHLADPTVRIDSYGSFRFARPALAGDERIPPSVRELDQALRDAITAALRTKGYHPAETGEPGALAVDYVIAYRQGANARRLDSPTDYARSWHPDAPQDGTGSMDHMVADVAFYGELALTVLLFPPGTGTLAWEGTAQRTFPAELPAGSGLRSAVGRMIDELLAPLPAR